MICVLISEFLPTFFFLVNIGSKSIFHIYKTHLFSDSHILFLPQKVLEKISAGNYLQIYQGSQTLGGILRYFRGEIGFE